MAPGSPGSRRLPAEGGRSLDLSTLPAASLTQLRLTDAMREAITACLRAHGACLEAIPNCLARGGDHADPDHVTVLMDCADVCHTTASLLLRGSDYHEPFADLCSEVCLAAAEDLGAFVDLDEAMVRCMDACKDASEACDRVVQEAA